MFSRSARYFSGTEVEPRWQAGAAARSVASTRSERTGGLWHDSERLLGAEREEGGWGRLVGELGGDPGRRADAPRDADLVDGAVEAHVGAEAGAGRDVADEAVRPLGVGRAVVGEGGAGLLAVDEQAA